MTYFWMQSFNRAWALALGLAKNTHCPQLATLELGDAPYYSVKSSDVADARSSDGLFSLPTAGHCQTLLLPIVTNLTFFYDIFTKNVNLTCQ
ncbi:MAG TPA: hypothetical protein IGR89_11110 [Oscillatoriaceae cyanobacterium M7585_C2015_266]|nr:hypothetical protein [Oscillatoriaceae cyanobacterium M7585_C2015_266]